MQIRTASLLGLVACAACAASANAGTVDLSFLRVTDSGAPDISSQFRLTVSSVAGQPGKVDLTLRNFATTVSSITEVYFADGLLLATSTILQQGSVFVGGSGNLPGAATLNPIFSATRSFRTAVGPLRDDGSAVNTAGLDRASDFATFRFSLQGAATADDVLVALRMNGSPYGNLRVGVVAHSSGGGARNDSFVNLPLIVPLPPAAWAGLVGLVTVAGAAWVRRRGHRVA